MNDAKTVTETTERKKKTGGGELLKTPAEMAAVAGFSKRTLERLTKARAVPVIRVGRLLFYEEAEVMRALKEKFEVKEIGA